MEENSNEIPYQNKLLYSAQALRNKFRQQIFMLLSKKNSCSFNEILTNLNISQPKLAYHLQILSKYNIITNFYDKREGVKDHSYYELTPFGRELVLGNSLPSHQTSIEDDEFDLNSVENHEVRFRTIQKVEYKSYEKIGAKSQEYNITSAENQSRKYSDPMLKNIVIKETTPGNSGRKINLPSFRKYYISYKKPFISKDVNEHKY